MSNEAVIFDAFGTLLKIQSGQHPYRKLMRLGQASGRRPRQDDARILMQVPLSLTEVAEQFGIRAKPEELKTAGAK